MNELKPDANGIYRSSVITKAGNILQLFYNPENDLVVVDLIRKDEECGNEIFRKTLNEKKLLESALFRTAFSE